jgi:hypothetical protein
MSEGRHEDSVIGPTKYRIVESTVATFFARQVHVRREANRFEDALSTFFSAPQVVPIPDDFQPEIPRLVMTSPHGHSVLEVSQRHASLKTSYDGEFSSDFGRCRTYLSERIGAIYPLVEVISKGDVNFSGISLKVEFPLPSDSATLQWITDRFVKVKATQEVFDHAEKFTFVTDDLFYVNLSVLNYRQYSGAAPEGRAVPAYLSLVESGLAVILDVNDRHGFNTKKEYQSAAQIPDRLLGMAEHLINTTVPRLFETGEVFL